MSQILIDTGPSPAGVHALEAFSQCPQLFAFQKKLQLITTTLPLVRGTLGHIGLAHYYARIMAAQRKQNPDMYFEPIAAIDEKIRLMKLANDPGVVLAEECYASLTAAVRGYMQNYAAEQFTIWGVENVVEMQFHGHRLTQRLDLSVVDKHGKIFIYDHKFVGAIQYKSVTRYTLSSQFLEMVHQGYNAYGANFGGCRINLIACDKPGFHRATPEPAPAALQKFPLWVKYNYEQIESLKNTDPWMYPSGFGEQICVTPYGPCPATELCRYGKPTT